MGKTRAEIQKAYRERQKLKGPAFLDKEKARQRLNYVPAAQLGNKKLAARNSKNKLRNSLSRLRKRASENNDNDSSGYGSMSMETEGEEEEDRDQPATPGRLIVKLPLNKRTNSGIKKVKARALTRAHRTIHSLKAEVSQLRKKIKTKNKKIERITRKANEYKTDTNILTPKRKTEIEISSLNLTPKRRQAVRRKILTGNVLMAEIEKAKQASGKKKVYNIHRVISGRIAKKYRVLKQISRCTHLSRRSLGQINDKQVVLTKERRTCLSRAVEVSVVEFLGREDNSRTQPGKNDAKKVKNQEEKKQTKVLTDYLKNLHAKYQAENPNRNISLTTFTRLRPTNILLASFISRNSCQCIHHQNMALKVQSLRKAGVKISENPEKLIIHEQDLDELLTDLPGVVHYRVWKKVEIEGGKMKMKIVDENVENKKFVDDLKVQFGLFIQHVERVREQYLQVRTLKESLPKNDMMLQMDFAENFACRSLDEVQTAYWNQSMVTLHPAVAYYQENGELKHKSFVVISDEMTHASSTVCAFLDKLVPALKNINPDLKTIHYWTDSPSSQYRNRYIFHTLAKHHELYEVNAKWNYFEVGHGKGPCDGLGGTTKRMADAAIKQGNATIQDATDFYTWAVQSSMKGVEFIYVSTEETKKKQNEMALIKTKPIKGTMKIHAIGFKHEGNGNTAMTRETSCYCETCLSGSFCGTWKAQAFVTILENAKDVSTSNDKIRKQRVENNTSNQIDSDDGNKKTANSISNEDPIEVYNDINVDNFVAVVYDGSWYIGRVEEKDEEDQDCEINFMQKAKQMYKWPQTEDRLWLDGRTLLCMVKTLKPSGKSKRLFTISAEEEKMIIEKFTVYTNT